MSCNKPLSLNGATLVAGRDFLFRLTLSATPEQIAEGLGLANCNCALTFKRGTETEFVLTTSGGQLQRIENTAARVVLRGVIPRGETEALPHQTKLNWDLALLIGTYKLGDRSYQGVCTVVTV